MATKRETFGRPPRKGKPEPEPVKIRKTTKEALPAVPALVARPQPGKPNEKTTGKPAKQDRAKTRKPLKAPGLSARDERRRQGSLQSQEPALPETTPRTSTASVATMPATPLLHLTKDPGLEQRVHAWLDVLVYVWRRRKNGEIGRAHV